MRGGQEEEGGGRRERKKGEEGGRGRRERRVITLPSITDVLTEVLTRHTVDQMS